MSLSSKICSFVACKEIGKEFVVKHDVLFLSICQPSPKSFKCSALGHFRTFLSLFRQLLDLFWALRYRFSVRHFIPSRKIAPILMYHYEEAVFFTSTRIQR